MATSSDSVRPLRLRKESCSCTTLRDHAIAKAPGFPRVAQSYLSVEQTHPSPAGQSPRTEQNRTAKQAHGHQSVGLRHRVGQLLLSCWDVRLARGEEEGVLR